MLKIRMRSLLRKGYKLRRYKWGKLTYIYKYNNQILTQSNNPVDLNSKMFLKTDWLIVGNKNTPGRLYRYLTIILKKVYIYVNRFRKNFKDK